jgi:hypothetical protein
MKIGDVKLFAKLVETAGIPKLFRDESNMLAGEREDLDAMITSVSHQEPEWLDACQPRLHEDS